MSVFRPCTFYSVVFFVSPPTLSLFVSSSHLFPVGHPRNRIVSTSSCLFCVYLPLVKTPILWKHRGHKMLLFIAITLFFLWFRAQYFGASATLDLFPPATDRQGHHGIIVCNAAKGRGLYVRRSGRQLLSRHSGFPSFLY